MTSMSPPPRESRDRLRAVATEIWSRSRDSHLGRVDLLERAATALLEGSLDEALREEARCAAHRLSGTAGTFGFHGASGLARAIELAFSTSGELAPDAVFRVASQVLALRRDLEQPVPPSVGAMPLAADRLVLLVGVDAERAEALTFEGATRGIRLLIAASCEEARAVITQEHPDAVVLELAADDAAGNQRPGIADGLALLSELGAASPTVPTLVVGTDGEENEMLTRLEVSRRGGRGPLPRSATAGDVLDGVRRLLEQESPPRFTVLVIDDDPTSLAIVRALLEPLGHTIVTLGESIRAWEIVEAAAPDLVVLDVDMPEVNGLELCRLIRGDSRWSDLPVLLLTAHDDAKIVHEAFAAGADDFVRKPVAGPELVTRVSNRLERSRLLRTQAGTDALTGVANRREGERELDRVLRLALRHRTPVCVALLDLDHFRALNDRHGHAAGDVVLQRLAQRLSRAFRAEDLVVRWGGEQFLVALYDSGRAHGLHRVGEVLGAFRDERFLGGDGIAFSVTASAGLAVCPDDASDARGLLAAAEAALYAAKGSGRDRVLSAGSEPDGFGPGRVEVAVVEDDPALAELLLHALDSRGHRATWLRDGREAAERLGGLRPTLKARVILLDVNLPTLDGLSLMRGLAADGVLRSTRVIVVSARASESEMLQAFELGAFDFVQKPFSVPVLLQRLRRALGT